MMKAVVADDDQMIFYDPRTKSVRNVVKVDVDVVDDDDPNDYHDLYILHPLDDVVGVVGVDKAVVVLEGTLFYPWGLVGEA